MKKGVFFLFVIGILFAFVVYAAVPDADQDGVPDSEDKCPDSDTTIVDQFGCNCVQKNCASDNNECTDDCSVIDGLPSCGFTNNDKKCQGGYCAEGECILTQLPSITINSCQKIQQSGNYVLDRDIVSLGPQTSICLNVHDGDNIHIDCMEHIISGKHVITINNVHDFSLKNCVFKEEGDDSVPFFLSNVSNGEIANNKFGDFLVDVSTSSNLKIINNIFQLYYQQQYSNNNLIENNNFIFLRPRKAAGLLISNLGSNNIIKNNRIDGAWNGVIGDFNSADDGIILGDENSDIVQDNFIKNIWDCGIETTGFISNSRILNNYISNAGFCGIGAWYWSSWEGNTVSDNIVDDALSIFDFFRIYGLRLQGWDPLQIKLADEYVYFKDNIFSNNKFLNPRTDVDYSTQINLQNLESITPSPGQRAIMPDDIKLSNNVFTNNDFGTINPAPFLKPNGMIVDGGGNICGSISEPDYPLRCGSVSNGMSPSGIVQSTGNPTYVSLRWPAFAGASHYNVRLNDGTSERIDDPRFETCPNSPHYYCENGIEETFIDGVPVKPGRKYNFWVDPIIPEREYFNIDTMFEVTRTAEPAQTQSLSGTNPSGVGTSDFVITQQATVSANKNTGPQNTIVIVAGIGSERAPVDTATANKAVFGNELGTANDFYIKNSYGRASLKGKVVGPYTLPAETCNLDPIRDEAIKAADKDVNFLDYSRIILLVPNTPCFPYGGVGGGMSEINTPDGRIMASVSWDSGAGLHVLAHELGHNFGLPHAGSKECFSCEPQEYGDRFDIMGTGEMHMNIVYKEVAGWPSNTITATQGEYLLKPLEVPQPAGAIQHIKLPLGNTYYSLEFRQPINYDTGAPAKTYSGVFIRHVENSNYPVTMLINYDPSDKTPLLQVGQTYKGPNLEDYEIFLKSADANGALVQIKPYKRTQFLSVIYPNGGEIWELGSTQKIKWESTNIPSDNKIDFIKLRKIGVREPEEHILFTNTINDGSEPWEVSSLLPGIYRLEIETKDNDEIISDISDKFEIVSTSCIDSDGGLDYSKQGSTYGKLSLTRFDDACIDNPTGGGTKSTGDYVVEFFCGEDGEVSNEIHLCPNKCVLGRCNYVDPNKPSIKIISPKKGDVWALGSNQRVEWKGININDDLTLTVNLTNHDFSFNMDLFAEKVSSGYKDIKVPDSIKPGQYRLLLAFDKISAGDITNFFEIRANANPISGRAIAKINTQDMQEVEGELEVIHADDFENPENSKYIHYIILDNKKYEIKSEDKLPVVLSGSKAKVKGVIVDGKFYLENYLNAHTEIDILKEKSTLPKTEIKNKTSGFFSSDWIYILTPAMIIIAYLLFLEAYRIKNR